MSQTARSIGPFARATREALEAAVPPAVASALLDRATSTTPNAQVPEEIESFRAFVEGSLQAELVRILGEDEIALVREKLGNVLWMATSDVRALNLARDWSRARGAGGTGRHERQSGSQLRVPPSEPAADGTPKRPTIRAPSSSPPESAPSIPRAPRSPVPPRAPLTTGVSPRIPRSAPTMQAIPRSPALPAPTCVLVVTLDAALAAQTKAEIAGRCPVIAIAATTDLTRAIHSAGERVVVLVDTTLPSIDLPTFVGLSPILPAGARVVIWGADERQRARLVGQYPAARTWIASGDANEPGLLALSLG